jgi:enoyl-CoA hydratase
VTVIVEREGPVVVITIDRPQARNAVDPPTASRLFDVFNETELDDTCLAVVLTGAAGNFCAGFDLKVAARPSPERQTLPPHGGPMGPSRLLSDRDESAPGVSISKPLIAAVEGYAVAGGLELALLADMRVASETAVFGVFCRRWGVPLIDGGTMRLPRIIGQGRAMDMILTGRPVDATEAHAWGLANRVVAAGRARLAAVELAQQIAGFPQLCLRADRASAYAGWSRELDEALRLEAQRGAPVLKAEASAGAARFVAGKGRGGSFE